MIMGGRVLFWCMIFVLKVMKGISQKLKEMQGPKWLMLFLGDNSAGGYFWLKQFRCLFGKSKLSQDFAAPKPS